MEIPIKPPKIVLKNHLGQIIFTLQETIKLVFKISPGYLFPVLILNALWGVSAVPSFYVDKLVIDEIVKNIGNPLWQEAFKGIIFLLVIRIALEIVRNILSRITQFLQPQVARLFSVGTEVLISKKMAELDIATFEDIEFKNRFNKIEQETGNRSWGLLMPLSSIPNYLTGFISSIFLLVLLNPLIALVLVVITLPQFLIDSKFIRKEYDLRTSLSPLFRMWGYLSWILIRNKNFSELKILNLAPFLTEKLEKIRKDIIMPSLELDKKRETYHILVYFPSALVELLLYVYFAFLTLIGKITIGSMQMYIQALRSAQQNIVGLVASFLEIYENYLYVVDLIWFLNLKPIISQDKGKKLSKKQEEIRFENVWFRYRKDTPWILKDINFTIKPGEKLAIVGENGAGKSTLIKLLARFYDPQKGNIYVGCENLKDLNVADWHKRLAVLFQKFESYPFSVRESIGYGDIENVDNLTEIKEAAQKTGIDKFIEDLPLKYDNPLAVDFEKGIDPSIGQLQRIGISRMLFRKSAQLLILDEPTSNVDPKAEEEIFQNLSKKAKDKILVFISQRFSTVRDSDQIFLIEKGKIKEQGNHSQLMKLNGTYAELFNLQAKGYQ